VVRVVGAGEAAAVASAFLYERGFLGDGDAAGDSAVEGDAAWAGEAVASVFLWARCFAGEGDAAGDSPGGGRLTLHKTDAGKADYRNERKKFGNHKSERKTDGIVVKAFLSSVGRAHEHNRSVISERDAERIPGARFSQVVRQRLGNGLSLSPSADPIALAAPEMLPANFRLLHWSGGKGIIQSSALAPVNELRFDPALRPAGRRVS
jgi:hypothetical protein